jgi:hypothetical protein
MDSLKKFSCWVGIELMTRVTNYRAKTSECYMHTWKPW